MTLKSKKFEILVIEINEIYKTSSFTREIYESFPHIKLPLHFNCKMKSSISHIIGYGISPSGFQNHLLHVCAICQEIWILPWGWPDDKNQITKSYSSNSLMQYIGIRSSFSLPQVQYISVLLPYSPTPNCYWFSPNSHTSIPQFEW